MQCNELRDTAQSLSICLITSSICLITSSICLNTSSILLSDVVSAVWISNRVLQGVAYPFDLRFAYHPYTCTRVSLLVDTRITGTDI